MSSSGQTHTGQPGPGISSIFLGNALRNPAIEIARSWPPQTFIKRMLSGNGNVRIRSSQLAALILMNESGDEHANGCGHDHEHVKRRHRVESPGVGIVPEIILRDVVRANGLTR